MLPTRYAEKAGFKLKELVEPVRLAVAGSGILTCAHQFQTVINGNGKRARTTVLVAPTAPAVLSSGVCVALGIHPPPGGDAASDDSSTSEDEGYAHIA